MDTFFRRRPHFIRVRLGGEPDLSAPFPERPAWMPQSVYDDVRGRALEMERKALAAEKRFISEAMTKMAAAARARQI